MANISMLGVKNATFQKFDGISPTEEFFEWVLCSNFFKIIQQRTMKMNKIVKEIFGVLAQNGTIEEISFVKPKKFFIEAMS